MNPLIDASVVKVHANVAGKVAEKMKFVFKLFSRDIVNVTVQAPSLPEFLEGIQPGEIKALLPPDAPTAAAAAPTPEPPGLSLVLPGRLGIVKAWGFHGTRVHVEFTILNNTDHLVAIRNVILLIGPGGVPDAALLKQFVDVAPDARVPSKQYRLPVVVGAKSGLWLCAELESPIAVNFGSVDRECTLVVSLNSGIVSCHFTAQGNPIFETVLDQIQETATEQQGAAAFELPISPLPRGRAQHSVSGMA
jgi:hypothetical protein